MTILPHLAGATLPPAATAILVCMAGKIRADGKCATCGHGYSSDGSDAPRCGCGHEGTERVHIDVEVAGLRHRIFCDEKRQSFKDLATASGAAAWLYASLTLAEIRIDIRRGTFHVERYKQGPASGFGLQAYSENWLTNKSSAKDATLRIYRSSLKTHIWPVLGQLDIRELRTQHTRQLTRAMRQKDKSSKTVANVVRLLHTILHDAWLDGDIAAIPPFERLTVEEPEYRTLDYDQQLLALAKVEEPYRPIFDFLIHTPIRPGEARALQIQDVDLARKGAMICRTMSDDKPVNRRKNGKGYWIDLCDHSCAILRAILDDYEGTYGVAPGPGSYVFLMPKTSRSRGKPFTKRLPDWWNKACVAAGVPTVRLYASTKHSWGQQALSSGLSLSDVQKVMGHARISSTERYAKHQPGALRNKVQLVELHRNQKPNHGKEQA